MDSTVTQSAGSPSSAATTTTVTNDALSAPPVPATPAAHPRQNALPRKRNLSDSADARQKRKVTRACDTCKAKKAKCSGTQPCESCQRRGLDCRFEARYSRGKPPTPPRRNPMAAGYSRDEAQLSTLVPLEPLHYSLSDRDAYQTSPLQGQPDGPSAPPPLSTLPHEQRASSIVEPPERADLAQEVPSRGSPELDLAGQFSDSTSGLSFLHRAWRRLSNNEHSQPMNGALGSSDENQLLTAAGDKPFRTQGAAVQIPPLVRARELLAMYFDVCIATYRLLHRPTVDHWLEIVVHNAESGLPLSSRLTRGQAAIILTALAVATFHEEKAKAIPSSGSSFLPVNIEPTLYQSDELFSEARRLTEGETGFPKLESAQVRLIQVLYLLMSSRMNQAWYTFGHALQIISALGLHRREDRKRLSHRRDYIEQQCRKRTFWVAYTLDKYLGVMFGRPRHYHDDDIDQDFPDSVNDEDMTVTGPLGQDTGDCHIESLVCHAKLAQIAEKISREVYSIKPVPDHERIVASHRLAAELRRWRASLPPFLGAINPSSLISSFRRQATALKLAYSHAVMLAHRPFLLKHVTRDRTEIRDMAKESVEECIAAAQSVLESVDRMARDGRLFHAFWWTHYVCFCALVCVYVWAIQKSDDGDAQNYHRIFDQAERCLYHLAQATQTNSPSRRYSIILQELRVEAKRKTARRQADFAKPPSSDSHRNHLIPYTPPASSSDPPADVLEPMFGSPIDFTGVPVLLDDWQTTDWLDLDSSAFRHFSAIENGSLAWMGPVPR